uniref:Oxoglutarate/iron-dependent oxygenase C-terminal degradation domain-containing protein n=1 Tax=Guillardia theta TaxID=55529 RepID=A0A7S4NKH7_GUITH
MFWEMSEIPGAVERRVSTQPTAVVEDNTKGILVAHAVIRHSAKEDRLRSIRDEIRNVSGHSHQDMSCQVDTVQDCSKELEKFVHPSYLAANSQTNIKKFFARDSAVQLHDFLTTSLYDEIWKGWELLPWRKAGPRNKKNHHQIDNEELQGMLMSKEVIGSSDGKNGQDIEIRALIRTFASQDFRQFLQNITGTRLEKKFDVLNVRRFGQGCYAMNHPSDDSNAVGVLEVVFVSADRGRTSSTQGGYDYKGWLQGHGGDLIYTTKDVEETNIFESEIEVCSIPPHGNTLSVVMMEEASQASSHVRYINQMAGDKCRHDILVRYKIVESGDEMSFESSEDREIESEEESFVPEDATIVHFRPALDGSHNITRSS